MTDRPSIARRSWFVVLMIAVAAMLATSVPTAPPAEARAPSEANVNWRPCYKKIAESLPEAINFECGVVPVPLDYSGNDGGTIQLSVVRIPAADQENKIGSLFTNPGGPSGSDVEFTLFGAPFLYSSEIRQKFDIVGFDPRGVVLSTPARCYGNYRKISPAPMAYPITDAEIGTWLQADAELQSACAQRGNKVLDHMSTANVARDMDMLREAVGDEQLTFIGYSYGTVLGATYANLFPDRVRAMALDSALDPVEWTTGYGDGDTVPVTVRLGSHIGAQDSLEHFFDQCIAAGDACPLNPDPAGRFDAVYQRLVAEPLFVDEVFVDPVTGEEFRISYRMTAADMIGIVLSILYSSDEWAVISHLVVDLEAQLFGRPGPPVPAASLGVAAALQGHFDTLKVPNDPWGAALADPTGSRFDAVAATSAVDQYATKVGPPHYYNWLEGFPGVLCADSDNPDDIGAWISAAADLESQGYYFGPLWTWSSSICNGWPADDAGRYAGPWDAMTANPVLVLTNTYDPATPREGAVALVNHLGNAQLLEVAEGRGHIAASSSQCAAELTERYVIDQALPPVGFMCPPNVDNVFQEVQPPIVVDLAETVTIEGPDGQPLVIETLRIDGEIIQPVLIVPASDGSLQVVEPVVVPLGTGEVAVLDTPAGPIELAPFDVEGADGELVTVQAVIHANAAILDVVPFEPPPPPPPTE